MIAQLTENLLLSGENEADNVDVFKILGVTAILNVGYEVPSRNHKDFLTVKVGIHEFEENPEFMKFLAIYALSKLIDNGNKVLVHCHAGAHRSPYIAFSYLAEKQNKTIDEIYQEMLPKIPWGVVYPPNIK